MNLYSISTELAAILGDAEDEIPDDLAERLDQLEMEFEVKAESMLKYRQALIAQAGAVGDEIDRLAERKRALESKADWLKSCLLRSMQQSGIGKISGPLFTVTVCKSPLKVVLADGEAVPDDYMHTEVKVSLDKRKVLEDFKAGITLPIGLSVTAGEHLKIS